MKNTTLSITFNTDKLDALAFHMGKKDAQLQKELTKPSRNFMKNMCHSPPVSILMTRLPGRFWQRKRRTGPESRMPLYRQISRP